MRVYYSTLFLKSQYLSIFIGELLAFTTIVELNKPHTIDAVSMKDTINDLIFIFNSPFVIHKICGHTEKK